MGLGDELMGWVRYVAGLVYCFNVLWRGLVERFTVLDLVASAALFQDTHA